MLNLNSKAVDTPTCKPHIAIANSFAGYMSHSIKTRRSLESEDSGFTLLESLVAAAVVGILIVSIAPMVALSTSARVNARRIDQATQAGRSYIDAVRGGVIDVTNFPNSLVANTPNAQDQYTFESIVAPTTTSFPPATICNNALVTNVPSGKVSGICVDGNGNGFNVNDPQDFFIQPMRSGPLSTVATASTDLKNQGFWLAIRVYRADALAGTALLKRGTDADTAPFCNQGNTAFASTASITCPVVTMRSLIFLPTVNPKNIDDIKKGIGS